MVDFHRETLPTFRCRAWGPGYGSDPGPLTAQWLINCVGVYGLTQITVDADWDVTLSPTFLTTLDTTLDMNSVSFPAGTAFAYLDFDPYLAYNQIYMSIIEGAENVSFPTCGTRSDLGGSVYLPGRMLKIGTVADDGTAT
jgi:hypothetical protein